MTAKTAAPIPETEHQPHIKGRLFFFPHFFSFFSHFFLTVHRSFVFARKTALRDACRSDKAGLSFLLDPLKQQLSGTYPAATPFRYLILFARAYYDLSCCCSEESMGFILHCHWQKSGPHSDGNIVWSLPKTEKTAKYFTKYFKISNFPLFTYYIGDSLFNSNYALINNDKISTNIYSHIH